MSNVEITQEEMTQFDTFKYLEDCNTLGYRKIEPVNGHVSLTKADTYLVENDFKYAIIDKAAPGMYTRRVKGILTDEDLSYLFTKPSVLETFINVLRSKTSSFASDILSVLSPNASATATIYLHAKIFTPESIQAAVMSVLQSKRALTADADVVEHVATIFTTLIIRFLRPLDVVMETLPVIELEDRSNRVPTLQQFKDGLKMVAIEDILRTLNYDVTNAYDNHAKAQGTDRAEKRSALTVYILGFARMTQQLAVDLSTVVMKGHYIDATLGYLRDWFINPMLVNNYPVSLASNASFRNLATNLTLTQYALSEEVRDSVVNWDFAVERCIEEFKLMLDNSKKFTVVPINELVKSFAHKVICDQFNAPKAVLVAQNYRASAAIQGFTFETSFAEWTNSTLLPTARKQAADALASTFAPATHELSGQMMLNNLHSLLSMSEKCNNAKDVLAVSLMVSPEELVYYAAALANDVAIYAVEIDGQVDYKFNFAVPFSKVNYVPVSGVQPDGLVHTFDPMELLIFVSERDASDVIESKTPLLSDKLGDNFLIQEVYKGSVSLLRFVQVSSRMTVKDIQFCGSSYDLSVELNRSLGLPVDKYALHILLPKLDAILWTTQMSIYLNINKVLDEMWGVNNIEDQMLIVEDSVATSLVSLLQAVNDAPFISVLTNALVRNLNKQLADKNEIADTHELTHRMFLYNLRTAATLQLLAKICLLPYETVTHVIDQFRNNKRVRAKIVNMLAQNKTTIV